MPDQAVKQAAVRHVPYVDLAAQSVVEKQGLMGLLEAALTRADFILGDAVQAFEDEIAAFVGVPAAVGVNSGTDALVLGMRALGIGPGDEVITPPNSFIASTSAIVMTGATPVFADVLDDQNIDPDAVAAAIGPKTKAIMIVHLTGRVCDMDPILTLAEKHGLFVIEDAAQAIGSTYRGRNAGTFGDIGCFSAHPLKNLNAAGDAGFVTCRSSEVAKHIRVLRNIGMQDRNTVVAWSGVSRLDTLQAEILRLRLRQLPGVIAARRRNQALYRELLDAATVTLPPDRAHEGNTWHSFVIQVDRRDALKEYLATQGIGSAIHYPVPIHLQPVAADLGYAKGAFPQTEQQAERILTLPIHQFLSTDDIAYVATTVNQFYS